MCIQKPTQQCIEFYFVINKTKVIKIFFQKVDIQTNASISVQRNSVQKSKQTIKP